MAAGVELAAPLPEYTQHPPVAGTLRFGFKS